MIINVTQEHIDKGKRGRACGCPVALAVLELLNVKYGLVSVSPYTLYIEINNYRPFRLPPEATRFVSLFDDGQEVSPFTFEVTNDPDQGESAAHQVSDPA